MAKARHIPEAGNDQGRPGIPADGAATAAAEAEGTVTDEHFSTKFECLCNAAYNSGRERFLTNTTRWANFVSIVFGSAAIGSFTSSHTTLGSFFTFIAMMVSAGQIAFNFESRARDHRDLKRRYLDIVSDIDAGKTENLRARFMSITADALPNYNAARVLAENGVIDSLYPAEEAAEHRRPITKTQRLFAQVWPFSEVGRAK